MSNLAIKEEVISEQRITPKPKAAPWRRILAYLIDSLIFYFCLFAGGLLTFVSNEFFYYVNGAFAISMQSRLGGGNITILMCITTLLVLAYGFGYHHSPGRRLLKIRVLGLDRKPPGFLRQYCRDCLARILIPHIGLYLVLIPFASYSGYRISLYSILGALPIVLALISVTMLIFSANGQSLLDFVFRTRIVPDKLGSTNY